MSEALQRVTPELPPGPVTGPSAWTGDEMRQRRDWLYAFSADELTEIDAAIVSFRASGRQLGEISTVNFPLPNLRAKLKVVLHELLEGRGFVQFRGFDVRGRPVAETAIAYLGLGSHFGDFRSQNAAGHLLGHVKDLGLDIRNPTTRYYQTTRGLEFHTDSCDVVGLVCLQTAKSGGESRICSSTTVYNEMLRRRPDLVPLLFNSFPSDRRGEVPPGAKPWTEIPVFHWHAGQLSMIYSGQYIRSAQENFPAARRLSPAEMEALDMIDALACEPAINLGIEFLPGDMQFVHNHTVMHSRTDFEDWPEPERRRHLMRLWLAPRGARPLPAVYADRYGSLTPGDRGGIVVEGTILQFVLAAG